VHYNRHIEEIERAKLDFENKAVSILNLPVLNKIRVESAYLVISFAYLL